MSYLALARRYRPRRFADVRGQDHVVRALGHALGGDRLHPAILLTGTRGVGKTTLGRILAKGLNCERGVSAEPCGECTACREVDEGRFIDLIEIDAASRTKVDDTRQLLDNVAYAPVRGRYKVYLIDEVHMLSSASFNALLKTLEEPPPHVKFILATTDPQKLPATVLSRCLQFALKRLPAPLIREALAAVLTDEKLEADPGALVAIARAADGSMRDALSLLDQAIAGCGGGRLQSAPVEEMLGIAGRRTLFDLLDALAAGDGTALLGSLRTLESAAPDYAALLDMLAGILQRTALLQVLPAARDDEEDDPALAGLVSRMAPEDVQLDYQIAVHGKRDLPWAPDPRLGFEMTVLRMFAFRPEAPAAGSTPDASSARVAAGTGMAAAAATADSATPMADDWPAVVERLGLDGMTHQLARHCARRGEDDTTIFLALDPSMRHLLTEARREAIERALGRDEKRQRRLDIEIADDTTLASPVRIESRQADERQRAAEAAVAADPTVRALRETFDARLRPGSVRLLDS